MITLQKYKGAQMNNQLCIVAMQSDHYSEILDYWMLQLTRIKYFRMDNLYL